MDTKNQHTKSCTYSRRLILLIAAAMVTSILTFYVLFIYGHLAAPPVTGSLSFDEKLFFIANNNLTDTRKIIAVGSSMTLNNLSSRVLVDKYSDNYLNFSSWGLTIKQANFYIRFLEEIYQPKIILIVSSPMDFYYSGRPSQIFNPDEVKAYLFQPNYISQYYSHFDPIYLLKNSVSIKHKRNTNGQYQSLMFDQNGGVMLKISNENIRKSRWDTKIDPTKIDESMYTALKELAAYLKNKNIKLVYIQPPLRKHAIHDLKSELSKHWGKLQLIATEQDMTFINLHKELNFGDNYFVDYSHLNSLGALKFTERLTHHFDTQWLN